MTTRIFTIVFIFLAHLGMTQNHFENFRSTRLINNQTTEVHKAGNLEFRISHRFGSLNSGASEFWGLDQATIRLGLEYGITDGITIGLGRSSYEKTVDSYIKARLLNKNQWQLTYYGNVAINTLPEPEVEGTYYFTNRLTYVNQLLLSKRVNDALSLQLIPSIVHKNLVVYSTDPNTRFLLGAGGKWNLTQVTSIQAEYHYRFGNQDTPSFENFHNSFSIGMGFETKGHFFEFHLTNSAPMIEKGYLTETTGTWSDGDIRIGFNIVRDF